MLRAVIVDDEELARKELTALLRNFEDIQLCGQGHDVDSGLKAIASELPDIVFLDIHLGENLGFEILSLLPETNFFLVITTAFEDYALQAFKHFAANYLLKPVSLSDLSRTIDHIKSKGRHVTELKEQITSLSDALTQTTRQEKISIPHTKGVTRFAFDQILRFEAEGAYTRIILKNEPPFLTSKNLGKIEEETRHVKSFFRIHRSSIINLNEVVHYTDARYIMMSDGEIINLARNKKKDFMNLIRSFRK